MIAQLLDLARFLASMIAALLILLWWMEHRTRVIDAIHWHLDAWLWRNSWLYRRRIIRASIRREA